MTFNQLVKYYGTPSAAANAMKTDRQRVHKWKTAGIPIEVQIEFEVLTGGALRADLPAAVRVPINRTAA